MIISRSWTYLFRGALFYGVDFQITSTIGSQRQMANGNRAFVPLPSSQAQNRWESYRTFAQIVSFRAHDEFYSEQIKTDRDCFDLFDADQFDTTSIYSFRGR